ncbi:MAG: polygalacturonase, partial [Dysgonamonadaceae bacterium]|nr:polygalacturonase [Dysgonamonadaceae bacterium]
MIRIFKNTLFLITLFCISACANNDNVLKNHGIVNDGKTLNTKALQEAIDQCSKNGGGIVSLPEGKYLTGTIILKKQVTLNLEKGAVILGSRDIADYPDKGRRKALIFAENAENIAITGEGEINGNGDAFARENNAPNRPTLVLFLDCGNVNVNGIRMSNSGFWTFRFVRCDKVNIHHVNVEGHANWNNDGFDIESKNVTISDCVLDTDDDAICLKSEDPDYVVENVTVMNCKLASNCNFIKFGTASAGGFRNVNISNCTLYKCSKSIFRFWEQKVPGVANPITGIAGIALEVVDGGFMENVT